MATPFAVRDIKIASLITTSMLNTLTFLTFQMFKNVQNVLFFTLSKRLADSNKNLTVGPRPWPLKQRKTYFFLERA